MAWAGSGVLVTYVACLPGGFAMRFNEVITAAIVGGIAGFLTSLSTEAIKYYSKNRELDIELVKIGVSILRADPKETQTEGAREWAVDTINFFSPIKFSPEAKTELLKNQLRGFDYGYEPGYDCTFDNEGRPLGCRVR